MLDANRSASTRRHPTDLLDISQGMHGTPAVARFLPSDAREARSFTDCDQTQKLLAAFSIRIVVPSQLKESKHEACDLRPIAGRRLRRPKHHGSERRGMRSWCLPGRLRRASRCGRCASGWPGRCCRATSCCRAARGRCAPQSVLIVARHQLKKAYVDFLPRSRQDFRGEFVTSDLSETLHIFGSGAVWVGGGYKWRA